MPSSLKKTSSALARKIALEPHPVEITLDVDEQLSALTRSDVVLVMASQMEPLSGTLTRLAALVSSNKCDVEAVADAIRMDPVLTLKLLRNANSAASASATKVCVVEEAVMRLGVGVVTSMAFALSVGNTMSTAVPHYGLAAGELWRHSAATAIAAEMLARLAPQRIPAATVTAALLHDIGKLIVAQRTSAEDLAFVHEAREQTGLSLHEAETEILEMNHADVGYIVALHWGLSAQICRAIQHHHQPEDWDDPMCDAVHLANLAARAIENANDGERAGATPSPEVFLRLGLHHFDFKEFCAQSAKRFSQLRAIYGA